MQYYALNLVSLLLGLIAWAIPCVCLLRPAEGARTAGLLPCSLSACAAALLCQILYTDHLVQTADWSALLDTSRAVAWAASLLLAVTLLLNGLVWHAVHKSAARQKK